MKIDITWLLIVAALGLAGAGLLTAAALTPYTYRADALLRWGLTAAALIIPAVWIAILYRPR